MARVLAWVAVCALAYGAAHALSNWRNPWAVPTVPAVMSVLPAQPDGCGESCK